MSWRLAGSRSMTRRHSASFSRGRIVAKMTHECCNVTSEDPVLGSWRRSESGIARLLQWSDTGWQPWWLGVQDDVDLCDKETTIRKLMTTKDVATA